MCCDEKFHELNIGDEFAPLIKKMTQEKINAYVSTAEDYNPIHVDVEFAKKTPFKGTIAPGFQCIAYISELMAREFGEGWYVGGTLDLRLTRPVRPGDTLVTRAMVADKKGEDGKKIVICEVRITNQNNEDVMLGTAGARSLG
ncbi:MAG: MaoC family dehydratase [Syntrophales bacterium]|nr:MaoC family dehydratase [Syntrophales bacterium]